MDPIRIDPNMTVDEIMRRWPATIRIFIGSGMLCVGCPIGMFHTISDACEEHSIDEASFLRRLSTAIGAD